MPYDYILIDMPIRRLNFTQKWNSFQMCFLKCTIFIPVSAQGTYINHFGWALICFNICCNARPTNEWFGLFQANSYSYWRLWIDLGRWLNIFNMVYIFKICWVGVPERRGTVESATVFKNVSTIFLISFLICLISWAVCVRKSFESIKQVWRCGFERGHNWKSEFKTFAGCRWFCEIYCSGSCSF